MTSKQQKRAKFTGISLEQKWKDRTCPEDSKAGNKSGNEFIKGIIQYNGKPRFS